MTPRTKIEGPKADFLRKLAIEHPDWTAGQVHRELIRGDSAPSVSLRTVQRFLGRFNRSDTSGRWSLADAHPEDAALVMPVVRFLIDQTGRLETRPSNAIAEWVIKIRGLRPDLPPGTVLEAAFLAQSDPANVPIVEAFLVGAIPALQIGVRMPQEGQDNG